MTNYNASITEKELREAFKETGLWRHGWDYKRAISNSIVLRGLTGFVQAHRKKLQQNGMPAPVQQALI